MSWKKGVVLILSLTLLFTLFSSALAEEKIKMKFTYWGSALEKKVVVDLVEDFMEIHPDVEIEAIHIPDAYTEKISAMVAGGVAPDVGYLGEAIALEWAEEGIIKDLTPYIESDPTFEPRLEMAWYYYDGGKKTLATNTAVEVMLFWYNKDMFDNAGVDYPPAKAEEAWTWDELVDVAKKMTLDRSGNHPDDEDFDSTNVKTFGISPGTWWAPVLPFIWSNEGALFTEDGMDTLIDSPETIEALQGLGDLIHKYHVAPTPAQQANLPSFSIMLQSQQVAMVVDGQWALLDLAQARFTLGVAPIPVFKKPVCVELGAPSVIFKSTKYPDMSWEFYKWHTSAEGCLPLLQNGLWMPLQTNWYTEPELLEKWLTPDVHPPEYKTAVVDYLLGYGRSAPIYYLRNWPKIIDTINADLDSIWLGEQTAEKTCGELAPKVKEMMQGRYDR